MMLDRLTEARIAVRIAELKLLAIATAATSALLPAFPSTITGRR